MQVTKMLCSADTIYSVPLLQKRDKLAPGSLFWFAPLPAAKGSLPAGGLIEILQGEPAGVSPAGTPSLRNRNILPKIYFDCLFQKVQLFLLERLDFSALFLLI